MSEALKINDRVVGRSTGRCGTITGFYLPGTVAWVKWDGVGIAQRVGVSNLSSIEFVSEMKAETSQQIESRIRVVKTASGATYLV